MGEKYLTRIICLFTFLYFCAVSIQNLECESRTKMKGKIYLVPIGNIEGWILDDLDKYLEKTFNCKVEIYKEMKLPQDAYNKGRNQYLSSHILMKLHSFIEPGKHEKVLGISNVDMYVKGLNFVFGEAELGGYFAIISLARLHQAFYGLAEDKALFLERTKKEAVHELGHVYGLRHCPDPDCVMHFSNSLPDTDRKSVSFCSRCSNLLKKIY